MKAYILPFSYTSILNFYKNRLVSPFLFFRVFTFDMSLFLCVLYFTSVFVKKKNKTKEKKKPHSLLGNC